MHGLSLIHIYHNHPAPKSLFDWVGFTTFSQVLEGRMAGTFFPLLTWTLIWAVAATATTFFFGIVLALLINTKGLKFKKVWRTLFVITIAVPQFVSLLLMRNFLNDDGPLNGVLQTFHITNGPLPFLTDPLWAKDVYKRQLLDEPTSALDPISAGKIEETLYNLKDQYTLLLVTRSMQQASRISQRTAFFLDGELIEYSSTKDMFLNPQHKETEDYITGKLG